MADATTISVLIRARDEASKAFKNVENNAGQMAQGIAKHRRSIGIAALGIGTAIGGIGVMMAKSAATFDAKMSEVNSLIGLTASEFDDLKQATLEMSSAIGVDAVGASEALYQAISAGVPKENVIDFMTIASKAAIAGVTSTEVAVDGLTTVMNAFKMPMEEAQRVADIMFVAVKGGKTTFEELGQAMSYVAPIAAALEVPFEEIGAAAATMTKQGIPTKMAFTALRQTFVSLMKPTEDMVDALDQIGFSTGRALLDAHGLQGGLKLLTEGTSLTEAQMVKAFGSVEAFGAVLALTGVNAEEAAADVVRSYNHMGAATDAFNIINASSARQWERLTAQLGVVKIELGNVLLPVLISVMEEVSSLTTRFMEFYREHPTLVKWLGLTTLAMGALLVVLGSVALMLPGLITGFTILWGVAFAPATAVILVVVAAVAAALLIWHKWEDASLKLKIALVALGLAIAFTIGVPITAVVAVIVGAIAAFKNWELIVAVVKEQLANTGIMFLEFARKILVAIKAVADFIPGLEGAEEALQSGIDMLDDASAGLKNWGDATEFHARRHAEDIEKSQNRVSKAYQEEVESRISSADLIAQIQASQTTNERNELKERQDAYWRDWEERFGIAQQGGDKLVALAEETGEEVFNAEDYFRELNLDAERKARNESRENYLKWIETGLADAERAREQKARIIEREAQDVERAAERKVTAEKRALERQLESWERFEQEQHPVMQALEERSMNYRDVLQVLADDADVSIGEMGDTVKGLGLIWGETFELINHEVSAELADLLGNIEKTTKKAAEVTSANLGTGVGQPGAHVGGKSISAEQIEQAIENWNTSMAHAPLSENELKVIASVQKHGGDLADIGYGHLIGGIPGRAGTGIPGFANGGMVGRGGLALVGERGPELVSLPGGSMVHPNGTGGGVTNQFHFHGAVYGVEDLKEAVVEAVRDHAISGGFSGVFAEA
jgi:TP901 family phage tail tape measure protein